MGTRKGRIHDGFILLEGQEGSKSENKSRVR